MDRYVEIRSFVLVAEKGSFAAASVVEGVTPVVMGRRLDALESRLGVKLMHRSTRGLSLTDLGEQFVDHARGLVREFDRVEASITAGRNTVRGHLVVSAPAAFGRRHVAPHALTFRERFPDLKLSFNFTDSLVDLVREGYDMAIRIGEVTEMKLTENMRAEIGMRLDESVKVPTDSSAVILSSGLAGAKYIELDPGGEERMLVDGGKISYTQGSIIVEELMELIIGQIKAKQASQSAQ